MTKTRKKKIKQNVRRFFKKFGYKLIREISALIGSFLRGFFSSYNLSRSGCPPRTRGYGSCRYCGSCGCCGGAEDGYDCEVCSVNTSSAEYLVTFTGVDASIDGDHVALQTGPDVPCQWIWGAATDWIQFNDDSLNPGNFVIQVISDFDDTQSSSLGSWPIDCSLIDDTHSHGGGTVRVQTI